MVVNENLNLAIRLKVTDIQTIRVNHLILHRLYIVSLYKGAIVLSTHQFRTLSTSNRLYLYFK